MQNLLGFGYLPFSTLLGRFDRGIPFGTGAIQRRVQSLLPFLLSCGHNGTPSLLCIGDDLFSFGFDREYLVDQFTAHTHILILYHFHIKAIGDLGTWGSPLFGNPSFLRHDGIQIGFDNRSQASEIEQSLFLFPTQSGQGRFGLGCKIDKFEVGIRGGFDGSGCIEYLP